MQKSGLDFLITKYFGDSKDEDNYTAQSVGNNYQSLESKTEILGGYCFFETPQSEKEQEKIMGRYSRENQLASAAACTSSMKASMYIEEALKCKNTVLLDKRLLIRDQQSGEIRIKELTALMIACVMGNIQTVQQIIEEAKKRLSPEEFALFVNVKVERNQGGNNALLYACSSSSANYMLVNHLVEYADANCNLPNDFTRNSLLIATRKNQIDVVELLLKKGVDINFNDANGCNALHIACTQGYVDTVKLLLKQWAQNKSENKGEIFDIDVKDHLSLTSLMKASINDHLEIVKLLLNFGANPRIRTANGESSLTLACMQENKDIVERLIIAKGDVNEVDDFKRTPLLKAARHNSKNEIIQLLLSHGARHDLADEEGNTPLHFAAQRGTVEVAKFLMSLGANPYARNNQELVPYEVATHDHVRDDFSVCPVDRKAGSIVCQHCHVIKYCNVECQKKDFHSHRKTCYIFQKRRLHKNKSGPGPSSPKSAAK